MTNPNAPSAARRPTFWLLFWPALAAAALHLALLARQVARHRGDLSALVCVGSGWDGMPPYEAVTTPVSRYGYDGQFYYALARRPWGWHVEGLDRPAARHLRILYPAVCWLCSGGEARLLFWVMPAVNLAAIGALAGLGAWLARRHGLSPWWGFLLPMALNVGLPAMRDLTDPLSTLAVAALLGAWLVRTPAWVLTACAAAALFSREQNAAIVLLLIAAALWGGRRRAAWGLLAAAAAWAGWVVALRLLYGVWPFPPRQGNFDGPLEGYLFRWTHLGYPSGTRRETVMHLVAMLGLTLQSGLAVYFLLRAPAGERLMPAVALAGVALAAFAGLLIYEDMWSYGRVLVWLPLGLWLTSLRARQRWVLLLLTINVFPTLVLGRVV